MGGERVSLGKVAQGRLPADTIPRLVQGPADTFVCLWSDSWTSGRNAVRS